MRIITGGQTGADQGALRAAKACGVETGGLAPKGWRTEAGPAPWLAEYGLTEHRSARYEDRTRDLVAMADYVIIFDPAGSVGSKLTGSTASRLCVPRFRISDLTDVAYHNHIGRLIFDLRREFNPGVLMVAGNRESVSPGIGAFTERFMTEVLKRLGAS